MSADLQALETRLHEPLTVHERVRVLNEMAEQLYERDAARGTALAREAIDLARATGDALGEAQGLYCLGRNLYSQADYPAVFESQAASFSSLRGPSLQFRTRPTFSVVTSPDLSRICTCFLIPVRVISNFAARSLIEASLRPRYSRTPRRVGSDRAAKQESSCSEY